MDLIRFIGVHSDDVELRTITEDSDLDSISDIPKNAIGFTYYHDNADSVSYAIGISFFRLDIVKKVNEKLYKKFIEFERINNGAQYLIGVFSGQVYLLCASKDLVLVDNKGQLQECLLKELNTKKSVKQKMTK